MPSKPKTAATFHSEMNKQTQLFSLTNLLMIVTPASSDLYCGVWHHDCFTLFYSAWSLQACLTSCFSLSLHLQPTPRLKYFPFQEPLCIWNSAGIEVKHFVKLPHTFKLTPGPWQCHQTMESNSILGPGYNPEGGVQLFLGQWASCLAFC